MKDKNTTTEQTAENSLPPKLAAALERIEAEGCESSRRVWELATWDCTPDEADAVVAAWEAKRAKAAELARATETAKETQPATKAEPAQDADPDFQFLGIPRRLWGPLTIKAWDATTVARKAEAEAEAAENALASRRKEIDQAEEEARAAEEEAAFAANRAKAAKEKSNNATSREELDQARKNAAEAEVEAAEAAAHAREARRSASALKGSLPIFTAMVERTSGNASRFRVAANAAVAHAEGGEVPSARKAIARAKAARDAVRVLEEREEARRNLPRVNCVDCKFWVPGVNDTGECHARPPSPTQPIVGAGDWCGWGETLTPAS